MRRKALATLLLTGALVVTPIGGGFLSTVATASSNSNVSVGSTDEAEEESSSNEQDDIADSISNAGSGDVIHVKGVAALSNGIMKELMKKGDVTLVLEYTYEGVDYVVTIPAGAAEDNDIPWYGPLYLAARYGNGSVAGRVNGASYTVKSGDTMGKIARENGMTLAQLAAKNPQISDVNRIAVGQNVNLK